MKKKEVFVLSQIVNKYQRVLASDALQDSIYLQINVMKMIQIVQPIMEIDVKDALKDIN